MSDAQFQRLKRAALGFCLIFAFGFAVTRSQLLMLISLSFGTYLLGMLFYGYLQGYKNPWLRKARDFAKDYAWPATWVTMLALLIFFIQIAFQR